MSSPPGMQIGVPLAGPEVSRALYRLSSFINKYPFRSMALFASACAATIYYEANYTHRGRVLSPYVNNHLEYDTYKDTSSEEENAVRAQQQNVARMVQATMQKEMEAIDDPELRLEMKHAVHEQQSKLATLGNSTMKVTSGQIAMRGPHWDIRTTEKNWSILARDQQHQKDSYTYRLERSKDDDYGRNSY